MSDEIYSELNYSDEGHSSISEFYPEKTIITNGASKWLGAGGWRLGFMIVPKGMDEVVRSMNMLQSETFSAVSSPIQFASIEGFKDSDYIKDFVSRSKNILKVVSGIF